MSHRQYYQSIGFGSLHALDFWVVESGIDIAAQVAPPPTYPSTRFRSPLGGPLQARNIPKRKSARVRPTPKEPLKEQRHFVR